ncbi:MAG: hypothetical protein ABI763_14370 [Bacteroidota bacterium]
MKTSGIELNENRRILTALSCAFIVTMFLFYIDEGSDDFRWMKEPGNWIPFIFYLGTLLGAQLLVSEVLLMKYSAYLKSWATILTAIALLIFILLAFSK